jgi:hypothetical protein
MSDRLTSFDELAKTIEIIFDNHGTELLKPIGYQRLWAGRWVDRFYQIS